jgi:hypothetical protein
MAQNDRQALEDRREVLRRIDRIAADLQARADRAARMTAEYEIARRRARQRLEGEPTDE